MNTKPSQKLQDLIAKDISVNAARLLANNYSPWCRADDLLKLLTTALPSVNLEKLPHSEVLKCIHHILLTYDRGERHIKAALVETFELDFCVAGFEVPCFDNRADFVTISKEGTTAYEIKSKNDNNKRLLKQVQTYQKIFDRVYVVAGSEKQAMSVGKLLPESCGIMFCGDDSSLTELRFAETSSIAQLDQSMQLHSMYDAERRFAFNGMSGEDEILSSYTEIAIWEQLNLALANRYRKKWYFLINNISKIYPADYQYLFRNNVNPDQLYQR